VSEFVTQRGLARLIGVHHRAVQIAVQNGRITPDKTEQRGQRTAIWFDPIKAVSDWGKNTDHSLNYPGGGATKKNGAKKPALGKPASEKKQTSEIPQAQTASEAPSQMNRARTVEIIHKAKLKELEYKARAGELVDYEKAKELFFDVANTVKQNILNVSSRIASLVAPENDPSRCYDIIDRELKTALSALSSTKIELIKADE